MGFISGHTTLGSGSAGRIADRVDPAQPKLIVIVVFDSHIPRYTGE